MKYLWGFLLIVFLTGPHLVGAQAAPQVSLTWDYNAAAVTLYGVTGFQMQRKAEGCAGALPFVNHVVIGPNLRVYVDTGVVPATTYCYRIFALAPVTVDNPKGNSDFSNMAEKRVIPGPIPSPTNLLAVLIQALIDALENYKTGLLSQ